MYNLDVMYIFPNVPEPRNENIVNIVKKKYKTGIMFWKKNPKQKAYQFEGCSVYEIQVKANDCNPLARLIPTAQYYKKALKILEEKNPKCIHVSKVDSMYLVWRYWKKAEEKPHIIYDISDLHTLAYNDEKNLVKILIRDTLWKIEKKISQCVDYILLTSLKFYDEYYNDFYNQTQVIFVPNAPDTSCFDGFKKKKSGPFTIGFIGSVRYFNQIKDLIDAANETGVNVFIAGSGEDEQRLRDYAKEMSYVQFYGKYNYFEEIRKLYENIDCVYALYDTSIKNVRIALPNKLYEGAYCGLPFIASKGVYVAEIIEKYGFGVSAEDGNKTDLINAINKIKDIDSEQVFQGCRRFCEANLFIDASKKLIEIYTKLVDFGLYNK